MLTTNELLHIYKGRGTFVASLLILAPAQSTSRVTEKLKQASQHGGIYLNSMWRVRLPVWLEMVSTHVTTAIEFKDSRPLRNKILT